MRNGKKFPIAIPLTLPLKKRKEENKMEKILTRTEMQDEIVHTFGFEHPMTISFFEACDTHLDKCWDTALRNLYESMMYIAQFAQEEEEVDA